MKRLLLATCSVLALSATPALADPISLAVAAVSTATTALSGGALMTLGITGLSTASALFVDFAVRATLGYALNALSSSTTRGQAASRGYQGVNQLGPALPHQVIYGETRIGGAVFYQTLSDADQYLHRLIAFAGHEINSYQAIYVNDEEVTIDADGQVTSPSKWAGKIRIKQYLGTANQAADSDLEREVSEWTNKHRARGIAYLYVRFYGASNFATGVPVVTAKIRGKKIYDPRTATTAWSDNPALCIRDYLLADYGLGETASDINDTLFQEAANECDTVVAGAKQYTCNGSFLLDGDPEDIIRNMLSSMGGIFWNYAGDWAILAAKYRSPTLSLSEDDLRSELQIATRHSRRDNFNAVRGQYKGSETNYQPDDYDEVSSGIYLREDGNIRAATELNMLFTDTQVQAHRIARTFLRRNRNQITVSGAFGLRAIDVKIGDNVSLSVSHLGWTNKVFEVVDWRLGMKDLDIQVNMILREMSEDVFTGIVQSLEDESGNVLQDESGNSLEAIVA